MSLVSILLVTAAGALAALAAYLDVVSLAALARRPPLHEGPGRRRFAILVPAHDEERVIARALQDLGHLEYPPERYDVLVVADNCTDDTAAVARAHGALVYERHDPASAAKGYALRWLLDRVRTERLAYDAFVVVDADSSVAPNFLRAMDARLEAGARAIQAHYAVRNVDASPLAALRGAAFASLHFLRPLGRAALGLSCGLKGNGMCFDQAILEAFGWRWFALAEDVEFHLTLVRAGERVVFAPETWVRADMPTTFATAATQNRRWERGRFDLLRALGPLLRDGIRRGNPIMLDAALEQLVPPLSIPVAAAALCAVLAFISEDLPAAVLASFALAGLLAHVIAGLVATRAPLAAYRALALAPAYIVWKLALYARAIADPHATRWVRTSREIPR
ncbi:MAG TPA: glycosyltransferase family 2 protein [Candidatus Limnocylindria bacterium]|nr:glycosyltransferase family 2 protein [Candidatus Limnocylindria bacterium]